MARTLIRTDKNGTKYYHCTDSCFKCGGHGFIKAYEFYAGGECFECNGSGVVSWEEKEMIPEYEAKLEARRKKAQERKDAKAIAESVEKNAEFFEKQGFNADGKTYVALGNTYAIKDALKNAGFKYNNLIGWHAPVQNDEFPTVEIDVDDVYKKDHTFTYRWNYWKESDEETYSKKIADANAELKKQSNDDCGDSEYIGEVGKRITIEAKYIRSVQWETDYGYGYWTNNTMFRHIFKDMRGNEITWKTSSSIVCDEGTVGMLTGTVKEHNEYNGCKQTNLTRCKFEGK